MSISDKLAFWKKKKQELDLDEPFDDAPVDTASSMTDLPPPAPGPSVNPYKPASFEQLHPPQPDPQAYQQPIMSGQDKDFQLINAKLDAIKATLDAVIQRLDRLDRNPPKW